MIMRWFSTTLALYCVAASSSEKHLGPFAVSEESQYLRHANMDHGQPSYYAWERDFSADEISSESSSNKSMQSEGVHSKRRAFEGQQKTEYADAVLFPVFSVVLSVLVYFLLTRFRLLAHFLPYTAVMFLIGTFMGIGTRLSSSTTGRHLHESILMWTNIQSDLLLLVFLPGIVFKNAISLNVHLFRVAFWQNIIFAFPLVLAGTVLTALVAYYMFPWGWSFDLCMTFGAILSATDPVAVAALMGKVGAPPRLQLHILGEALLNDGSAIVFYSIFVLRYLLEMGVDGVGEDVGWARGVGMFCRMSFGGAAVGIFFGSVMLIVLKILDRRFTREENVTQVAALLAFAYLNYYCADIWETSGVIATVAGGLTVAYFDRSSTNDQKLLDDFWSLLDHLLNTVLFTLGGLVWGEVLASSGPAFGAKPWGYLVLLYVMLVIIRSVLFVLVYPLINAIGLQTSPAETVFQVHGGLRGAVGIALALALDNQVTQLASADPLYAEQSRRVFGLVGGIAFLTLVLNAPTCKPLLKYLQLSESTGARKKILDVQRKQLRKQMLADMLALLSEHRFHCVRFPVIRSHISMIAVLTTSQLDEAVDAYRARTPAEKQTELRLDRIFPYLDDDRSGSRRSLDGSEGGFPRKPLSGATDDCSDQEAAERPYNTQQKATTSNDVKELRLIFLSMLQSAYKQQVSNNGELTERDFLTISLEQSIDLSHDHVVKGQPLSDWDFLNLVDPLCIRFHHHVVGRRVVHLLARTCPAAHARLDRYARQFEIERALAFIAAHRSAQSRFTEELGDVDRELTEAGSQVMGESETQVRRAKDVLERHDPGEVERVASHKFCSILLDLTIKHIGQLVKQGLLKEEEATPWVSGLAKEFHDVRYCGYSHGP